MALFFADIVTVVHLAYVAFVLFSIPLILLGGLFKWSFTRNPWFRWLHVVAISVVVVETLLGVECPLTTLEDYLTRDDQGQINTDRSFVARLVHSVLFFDTAQPTQTPAQPNEVPQQETPAKETPIEVPAQDPSLANPAPKTAPETTSPDPDKAAEDKTQEILDRTYYGIGAVIWGLLWVVPPRKFARRRGVTVA
jgi:hypothetical protein